MLSSLYMCLCTYVRTYVVRLAHVVLVVVNKVKNPIKAHHSTEMADSGAGSGPRDAAVMESILKEMGVEDYDPNVVHQMLEFSYSEGKNTIA